MSARSIRRAAERNARKLARVAAREQPPVSPESSQTPEISAAQLAANRVNALLSTGPRTEEGRRASSLNAVKTGLTGATVLLPTDDAAEYQRHIAAYEKELQPVGLEESELVQSLADIAWRLRRIPALEMAIYAQGRIEFADMFEDQQDPAVRRSLIELHTHLIYEKQLRNLQLQESRLVRRREKETAALRRLQEDRKQREREQNGFEFSNPRSKAGMPTFTPPARPENAPPLAAGVDAFDAQTRTALAMSLAPSSLL
jgi:hypothetical protein